MINIEAIIIVIFIVLCSIMYVLGLLKQKKDENKLEIIRKKATKCIDIGDCFNIMIELMDLYSVFWSKKLKNKMYHIVDILSDRLIELKKGN